HGPNLPFLPSASKMTTSSSKGFSMSASRSYGSGKRSLRLKKTMHSSLRGSSGWASRHFRNTWRAYPSPNCARTRSPKTDQVALQLADLPAAGAEVTGRVFRLVLREDRLLAAVVELEADGEEIDLLRHRRGEHAPALLETDHVDVAVGEPIGLLVLLPEVLV